MRVLVTGASGFVGQYVIRNLIDRGYIEIVAVTRDKQKVSSLSFFNQVQIVECDIAKIDHHFLGSIGKVDALIHLAWDGLPNYKESFHIDKNLFESYFFCKKLIEFGIKNITIVGTCFEYGMVDGCLSETMYSVPNNAYATAKDSLRKFIDLLHNTHTFSFKWVRLFYMYGAGQAKNSLISQLEQAIQRNDLEFNMSGGEQLRDYLPIDLVADYLVSCSLQTEITGIINCCSGRPISVRKFVEKYLEEKNINIKLNLGYYPYADYEPMAFWGDDTKLKKILSLSNSK
ncbi:MAG: NAD(P)-dependent oxidoreductase [Leptospiraceae bacterium]|nr:NAD(P)-dependent oxidoreductase [Leptospiraceae bacterium]